MSSTALVLIDPYNDFVSRGGKAWPMTRTTGAGPQFVARLARALDAARAAGHEVAYAPHHRWRPGSFANRKHLAPTHLLIRYTRSFKRGGWGGRFPEVLEPRDGEIVASEHETSCGFVGTDLDPELRQREVERIVLAGALSNTCVASTARTGRDLGYEVDVISDCVIAQSPADHRAALLDYPHLGGVLTLAEFEREAAPGA